MNADLEQFLEIVRAFLPNADLDVDLPEAGGSTFVVLHQDEHTVWAEHRPGEGFGISAGPTPGYGEGPDELHASPVEAARRVVELVNARSRSCPPREVLLRDLRRSRNVSQQALAAQLGVQQAAVSRAERRGEDMSVAKLREFVEGVGGELEIRARFGNEEFVVMTGRVG